MKINEHLWDQRELIKSQWDTTDKQRKISGKSIETMKINDNQRGLMNITEWPMKIQVQ